MECNTVEFFIDTVRNYPCLWNTKHVAYRDLGRKDVAWDRVAKECCLSDGKEAKIQWKKLRDSHREALRRRKLSFGPSAQHLKPWKYEENMKFVKVNIKKKTETKESTSHSNESNDTQDSYDDAVDTDITTEVTIPEPVLPIRYQDPLLTDKEIQDDKYRERRERRMELFDSYRSVGLSKLFESFCQKTRELPKYLQLRVQREIFESVSRAEEEALSLNSDPINIHSSVSFSSSQGYNNANNIDRDLQKDSEPEDECKFIRQNQDS